MAILKKALFEHYWNFFAPYRVKRAGTRRQPGLRG